jgi:hypothetical protein
MSEGAAAVEERCAALPKSIAVSCEVDDEKYNWKYERMSKRCPENPQLCERLRVP